MALCCGLLITNSALAQPGPRPNWRPVGNDWCLSLGQNQGCLANARITRFSDRYVHLTLGPEGGIELVEVSFEYTAQSDRRPSEILSDGFILLKERNVHSLAVRHLAVEPEDGVGLDMAIVQIALEEEFSLFIASYSHDAVDSVVSTFLSGWSN